MNKLVKVMLLADSFMLMAIGMLTPIYAIFVEEIGGDILSASGAWAAFTMTAGLLTWAMGKFEDGLRDKGIRYRQVVFVGYFIRCLAFLGYFFVADSIQLFAVQMLLGLGVAISLPAYDALYSGFLRKGRGATGWGAWEGMNLITSAVAALIGGFMATVYGFKLLFMVMFFISLMGLILSLKFPSKKY